MPKKIATWDYCRKSTKGEVEDQYGHRKQRQEDSIQRQREGLDALQFPQQIRDAGFDDFELVGEFDDPGVSGWKIADRPGLQAMLAAISDHPARCKAVRCDTMARLTRASLAETQALFAQLKEGGVRWIVISGGHVFDLGADNDIASYMMVGFHVWQSHQESEVKSWNVSTGMRVAAKKGKRMGSVAPYAMQRDKEKGLVPGDADQIAVVQRIFEMFANDGASTHAIADVLNDDRIPGPRGGQWYAQTIGDCLVQPAYAGRYEWGRERTGRFHQITETGELKKITTADFVEVTTETGRKVKRPPKIKNAAAPVTEDGVYEAIVNRELWDRAQKRLANQQKANRKPRIFGYSLSHVPKCGHCGAFMTAATQDGDVRYRCPTAARGGECRRYSVAEHDILPVVLGLLDQEIDALTAAAMTPKPPPSAPKTYRITREIEKLDAEIARWTRNIKDVDDFEIRQQNVEEIRTARAKRDALKAEQQAQNPDADATEAKRVIEWYTAARAQMTQTELPVDSAIAKACYGNTASYLKAWGDETFQAHLNKRKINETLHALGCQVELLWTTKENANRPSFTLEKIRFRLGQRSGELVGFDNHGSGKPGFFPCEPAGRITALAQ